MLPVTKVKMRTSEKDVNTNRYNSLLIKCVRWKFQVVM